MHKGPADRALKKIPRAIWRSILFFFFYSSPCFCSRFPSPFFHRAPFSSIKTRESRLNRGRYWEDGRKRKYIYRTCEYGNKTKTCIVGIIDFNQLRMKTARFGGGKLLFRDRGNFKVTCYRVNYLRIELIRGENDQWRRGRWGWLKYIIGWNIIIYTRCLKRNLLYLERSNWFIVIYFLILHVN